MSSAPHVTRWGYLGRPVVVKRATEPVKISLNRSLNQLITRQQGRPWPCGVDTSNSSSLYYFFDRETDTADLARTKRNTTFESPKKKIPESVTNIMIVQQPSSTPLNEFFLLLNYIIYLFTDITLIFENYTHSRPSSLAAWQSLLFPWPPSGRHTHILLLLRVGNVCVLTSFEADFQFKKWKTERDRRYYNTIGGG